MRRTLPAVANRFAHPYYPHFHPQPANPQVMDANLFYAAAALGAVALFLLMQPQTSVFRAIVTMAGLAGVGLLISVVAKSAPAPSGVTDDAPFGLYVLMAIIAVVGAVRMVTHPKPVYAALYFILVILASAATFLLMQAEFMAFALVIVYAGAILITYLFVLMLAQQSSDQAGHDARPSQYDRLPREPVFPVILGFVVLATLGDALFSPAGRLPWATPQAVVARADEERWGELRSMPGLLLDQAREAAKQAEMAPVSALTLDPNGRPMINRQGNGFVVQARGADGAAMEVPLSAQSHPDNSQSLGWALVAKFPVSLELAGVVLLMAMFGAVVLARKQIELADDERRSAVGLPRLTDESPTGTRGGHS